VGLTHWHPVNNALIVAGMNTATFGTANHPFRATLPLRVLKRLPRMEPEVEARIVAAAVLEAAVGAGADTGAQAKRRRWLSAQEMKEFLIAYIACFMAISAWIS
jgi:hypothetical protein